MAQLVTRVEEALLLEVDQLVIQGVAASRSDLVRMGLERIINEHRRKLIGLQIAKAYQRIPESNSELNELDAATRALIDEEPW